MSRGPHPDDATLFAPELLPKLRRAAEEVSWLLGRGYSMATAVAAAGNHHQLEQRQRVALARGCSSDEQRDRRRARCHPVAEAHGHALYIDALNVVIALEVALCGGVLIRGRDGALRDLAGLRGTYRITKETGHAVELVGDILRRNPPRRVVWLLDQPVSNSGRLRALIVSCAAEWPFPVEAELVPNPDPLLAQCSGDDWVASADALILDACGCWVNLAREVASELEPRPWIVDLGVAL